MPPEESKNMSQKWKEIFDKFRNGLGLTMERNWLMKKLGSGQMRRGLQLKLQHHIHPLKMEFYGYYGY